MDVFEFEFQLRALANHMVIQLAFLLQFASVGLNLIELPAYPDKLDLLPLELFGSLLEAGVTLVVVRRLFGLLEELVHLTAYNRIWML